VYYRVQADSLKWLAYSRAAVSKLGNAGWL